MGDLARPLEGNETRVSEKEPDYEARTPLGRKLVRIREQIEQSGVPLLDWDELEREIAERRGERNP